MKYYETLLKMGCFTWDELCGVTENQSTASTLIQNYLKKGYIQSVKRGLYVAVNLADNAPVISKFRIAGKITASAYISHHTAFEYYGCVNQVSHDVVVSSEARFNAFEFNGNTYSYIASRISGGIVLNPDGVRVTDTERTVLDSINDFEKVAGLEELLRCLEMIPVINEDKLLEYLNIFNKQALYQKAGYILEHFKELWGLSDDFFLKCKAKIGKSKRYFSMSGNSDVKFDSHWKLVAPSNLLAITRKGVFDTDVEI